MGMVAELRGLYDEALEWTREALRIFEELGNHAGMAHAYGQLGIMARTRGANEQALEWTRKALQIFEVLGNRNCQVDEQHRRSPD